MAATCGKLANDKTKFSTFGYIRRIEPELEQWNCIVPVAIKYYCIGYYFQFDYFTVNHGDNIMLDKGEVIAEGKTNQYKEDTVHGKEIIDLTNHGFKYEYKFKASQIDVDAQGFGIGIVCESNKRIAKDSIFKQPMPRQSHFLSNKGCISGYRTWSTYKSWNKECVIKMVIDFENVDFYKNGEHVGSSKIEPFDVSLVAAKYRLCARIAEKGQRIEIMEFNQYKSNK